MKDYNPRPALMKATDRHITIRNHRLHFQSQYFSHPLTFLTPDQLHFCLLVIFSWKGWLVWSVIECKDNADRQGCSRARDLKSFNLSRMEVDLVPQFPISTPQLQVTLLAAIISFCTNSGVFDSRWYRQSLLSRRQARLLSGGLVDAGTGLLQGYHPWHTLCDTPTAFPEIIPAS